MRRVIVVSFLNNPEQYHLEIRTGPDPQNYICDGPEEDGQDFEDISLDLEEDNQTLILAWIENNT